MQKGNFWHMYKYNFITSDVIRVQISLYYIFIYQQLAHYILKPYHELSPMFTGLISNIVYKRTKSDFQKKSNKLLVSFLILEYQQYSQCFFLSLVNGTWATGNVKVSVVTRFSVKVSVVTCFSVKIILRPLYVRSY